jgi:hypothetical protein
MAASWQPQTATNRISRKARYTGNARYPGEAPLSAVSRSSPPVSYKQEVACSSEAPPIATKPLSERDGERLTTPENGARRGSWKRIGSA